MGIRERIGLPRLPRDFSEHTIYPFVLRNFNSSSVELSGLGHGFKKPLLRTNFVLFVAERIMHRESR